MCVSVTRSTDCGQTWRKEHTFAYGASAEREDEEFYGHHGMAQLADGTILLPYNVYGTSFSGIYNRTVCVRKSVDQGHTWSEPIVVIPGPGPADGWAAAVSYGKIRTLHDGTVILPIIGRREGDSFGRHGFLTSSDGGETWERYVTAACDRYSGDEADFLQLPSGRILCVNRDPSNTHGHGVGHLHIGRVAFCYVKEEGLDWSGETHIAVLNHLSAKLYWLNLGNWKYFFCRMPLTNRSLICSKQVVHTAWVRTKVLPFNQMSSTGFFLRCIGC